MQEMMGAKMDDMMIKAHGRKEPSVMMAHQGASVFMSGHSAFPAGNPLKAGNSKKVIQENIKTEMQHGKPHKMAIAIAMNKAGLSRKK